MNKIVMFVRYINGECFCERFESLNSAIKWVYKNQNWNKPYNQSRNKKIKLRIKSSIELGSMYCGGYWIIKEDIV